jgi:hypothetical protein
VNCNGLGFSKLKLMKGEMFPNMRSLENKFFVKYSEEIEWIELLIENLIKLLAISITSLSVSCTVSSEEVGNEAMEHQGKQVREKANEMKMKELSEYVEKIHYDFPYVNKEKLVNLIENEVEINHIASCLAGKCLIKVVKWMSDANDTPLEDGDMRAKQKVILSHWIQVAAFFDIFFGAIFIDINTIWYSKNKEDYLHFVDKTKIIVPKDVENFKLWFDEAF